MPRPDHDGGVPTASRTYRVAAGLAFGLMRAQRWQFDVAGLGHVPSRGGVVVAANHMSFWDFFTVGKPVYEQLGRPVRILAKASLFHVPVFGPLMRAAEHIPVERAAGAVALRAAVEALRDGEVVLVLPEQTISPAFELLPFKSGAARMAAAAGVPLVPAASWGTHRFHTVQRLPRPHWRLPVGVAFGAPLRPAPDEPTPAVTRALRTRVAALLDELVKGYADGTPQGAWWVPARLGGGAPDPASADQYVDRVRHGFSRRR